MPKKLPEPPAEAAPEVAHKPVVSDHTMDHMRTKRRLTLDVVSITKLGEIVMCCRGELQFTELPSKFSESGRAMAWTIDVMDCIRGEEYTLACNAVLASSLQRAGQPLTGRYFSVHVGESMAGKRYRRTDVVELEKVE